MQLRRLLIRLRGLQHPPLASSTLMLLLCLFWLMGIGESWALVPGLLLKPFHAYRLVTYCLCHTDATHLLFNVILFPLLGWHQELRLGTLRYLHASLFGATVSALLYLLLAGLWGAQPAAVVGGYTPVHLAMLGHHQRQRKQRGISGVIPAALAAGVLLGLSQLLLPSSPFLLHASGLLTCLACPSGASNIPFSVLHESLVDEEMLQAGIQASLQDVTDGEVKLFKSSVSSLRLQQLQKMGFPTEQAVVALAATGHVEGAVSLLTGGHVGDAAVVTSESQSAHRKLMGPN